MSDETQRGRRAKVGKQYAEDESSGNRSNNSKKSSQSDVIKSKKKDKDKKKNRDSSEKSSSVVRKDKKKKDKDKSKKKKDKDKKKNKHKDSKSKNKKSKSAHKAKLSKVKRSGTSSDDDSDEKESDHWSAGDANIDYGDPDMLSDDSDIWPDNLSNELYDSDNPDCPLNAYHIESRPRLIKLEDFNNAGAPVSLYVDCLEIMDEKAMKAAKKKNLKLKMLDRDDKLEEEIVDHKSY